MEGLDLERSLRLLKLHDDPRLSRPIAEEYGSVAQAWLALGRQLQQGDRMRTDRVSAREAYKSALKGHPGVAATAAFLLAALLEDHPELCEEYSDGRQTFGTSPTQYWREGAKLAIASADARFRFWVPNQRSLDLAAALAPLIARRAQEAAFGDVDAMYELSQLLQEGFGVPRNQAAAANWLRRAALAGSPGAACRLKLDGWQAVLRRAVAPYVPEDNAPALAFGAPAGPGDAPTLGGGPVSPFQLLRAELPVTLPARWPGAVPEPRDGDVDLADAGDVEAQLRLGSGEDGLYWLTLAAAAGHPSAFPLRDALPPSPDAEERAAVWWERQANLGSRP